MEERQAERKDRGTKKKRIVLIAAAAALALLVCAALLLVSARSPKAVAERYVTALIKNDTETQAKLWADDWKASTLATYGFFDGDEEAFFEKMSDQYGEDVASWKDYSRVCIAHADEERRDLIGKYKIKVEATKLRETSVRKLRNTFDAIFAFRERHYGLDPDGISKGAEVTVKARISGEDDLYLKSVYTVYLVKIGPSWKVLTCDMEYK